ncbi:hypothetical protein GDO81_030213 [Engystomops pustulosus]|uniref:Uncharacterized protein n=1 Tax=Engystomops pustulosus TaxID=76066 RepID=A0AAV6ZAU5_ENGPU|nr:hypothetical protein GDO81_030213 [Engystomops pustulosus]
MSTTGFYESGGQLCQNSGILFLLIKILQTKQLDLLLPTTLKTLHGLQVLPFYTAQNTALRILKHLNLWMLTRMQKSVPRRRHYTQ